MQSGLLPDACPLGEARAQLHDTYIISETGDGMVLVDQHAAHERIVYEQLKASLAAKQVAVQGLLIPEIIELEAYDHLALLEHNEELAAAGLRIDGFGPAAVAVREVPALFGQGNLQKAVKDIAAQLRSSGMEHRAEKCARFSENTMRQNKELERRDDSKSASTALEGWQERMHGICASIACHASVRAGRKMRLDEMNALLRTMEATPNAAQCNHGRPTYVHLSRESLERLFQRR
jgi:DNA mismatch repair protein MutL